MTHIPNEILQAMVDHAKDDLPNEACGMILIGRSDRQMTVHRVTNTAASPYRYEMSPLEMMKLEQKRDSENLDLFAIYHSHVASAAYPSPTDVRMAFFPPGETDNEPMFPETYYVLVSLENNKPDVRAFHIKKYGEISEESIESEN